MIPASLIASEVVEVAEAAEVATNEVPVPKDDPT